MMRVIISMLKLLAAFCSCMPIGLGEYIIGGWILASLELLSLCLLLHRLSGDGVTATVASAFASTFLWYSFHRQDLPRSVIFSWLSINISSLILMKLFIMFLLISSIEHCTIFVSSIFIKTSYYESSTNSHDLNWSRNLTAPTSSVCL